MYPVSYNTVKWHHVMYVMESRSFSTDRPAAPAQTLSPSFLELDYVPTYMTPILAIASPPPPEKKKHKHTTVKYGAPGTVQQ